MVHVARRFVLLLTLTAFVISGCSLIGSNGSSPDNAPSFPDLEKAEADVSYFENHNPKVNGNTSTKTSNYYAARGVVLAKNAYSTLQKIYGKFFEKVRSGDPKFVDGIWKWVHSIDYLGITAEVSTTAERISNNREYWAMFWTYEIGDRGIEDYKVMDGTVAEDGSQGEWTFNKPGSDSDEEVPILGSQWTIKSDKKKVMTLSIYDDGAPYATAEYERDGSVHEMSFYYETKSGNITVGWNTDTKKGYIIENGDKKCWDGNFENVPCN